MSSVLSCHACTVVNHAVVETCCQGGLAAGSRVNLGAAYFGDMAAPLQAGNFNDSPRLSTTQHMCAFLAAMATTAFQ